MKIILIALGIIVTLIGTDSFAITVRPMDNIDAVLSGILGRDQYCKYPDGKQNIVSVHERVVNGKEGFVLWYTYSLTPYDWRSLTQDYIPPNDPNWVDDQEKQIIKVTVTSNFILALQYDVGTKKLKALRGIPGTGQWCIFE